MKAQFGAFEGGKVMNVQGQESCCQHGVEIVVTAVAVVEGREHFRAVYPSSWLLLSIVKFQVSKVCPPDRP